MARSKLELAEHKIAHGALLQILRRIYVERKQ